jgi:ribosomal protein S18 acetylase RimI-like enzyme
VFVAVPGQGCHRLRHDRRSSREAFAPWEAEISMIYVLKENRGGGIGRA